MIFCLLHTLSYSLGGLINWVSKKGHTDKLIYTTSLLNSSLDMKYHVRTILEYNLILPIKFQ